MQIGVFTLSNDGGWAGSIRTLTIDARVRLVPNDDRTHDNNSEVAPFAVVWMSPKARRAFLQGRLLRILGP